MDIFRPQVGCHLDVASVFTLTEFRIHGIFQITAMEKKYCFRQLKFFIDISPPQIQVSPRWPVGSPQLMGRSDVVGHHKTLLRVDNSTLGYSWAPRDSTQSGLLYSWASSDSTQVH